MRPANSAAVKFTLADDLLHSGQPVRLRALGTSMLPSIWPGDALELEHCDPADVAVGDVIRFMQQGRFIIHRVVRTQGDGDTQYWITRGDALDRDDAPVSKKDFLGRVSAVRRRGKLISPRRSLPRTARWLGRALARINHIQGIVLRMRALVSNRPTAFVSKVRA
jgi:hypothetical protein